MGRPSDPRLSCGLTKYVLGVLDGVTTHAGNQEPIDELGNPKPGRPFKRISNASISRGLGKRSSWLDELLRDTRCAHEREDCELKPEWCAGRIPVKHAMSILEVLVTDVVEAGDRHDPVMRMLFDVYGERDEAVRHAKEEHFKKQLRRLERGEFSERQLERAVDHELGTVRRGPPKLDRERDRAAGILTLIRAKYPDEASRREWPLRRRASPLGR
jgi:hypothetical protein